MEQQKKNWLITAIVILILAIILIIVFWSRRNGKDDTDGGTTNPTVSSSEAGAAKTESSKISGQNNLQSYMKEQDDIMSDMMEDMHAVQKTGNASVHFLKGMTPHHESAIEMAESYLTYGGDNSKLKKLAYDIIEVQTKEIDDMEDMIKKIEDSGKKDEEKEAGYLQEYDKMMESHHDGGHTSHNMPANVDQAFAEGMIMHHQMAVDMAKAILTYTDEEDVKSMAQAIVEAQEMEIEQMQEILMELGKES